MRRSTILTVGWCYLFAQALYIHAWSRPSLSMLRAVCTVALVTAVFVALVRGPLALVIRRLRYTVPRDRWLVRGLAACAIGLWLSVAIPLPAVPGEAMTVSVEALGEHAPASGSSEVWVAIDADGRQVPFEKLETDGTWLKRDNFAVSQSPKQPAKLTWHGAAMDGHVVFVAHAWSGKARLTVNDTVTDLDLYDPNGSQRSIALAPQPGRGSALSSPSRGVVQKLAVLLDAFLLGAIAVALYDLVVGGRIRWVAAPEVSPRVYREGWRAVLAFGTPALVTHVLAWLLFFPAVMTSDSLDQWTQFANHNFHDWHPPLHTIIVAGLRLFWNDPAIVAACQIAAMSATTGYLIAVCRRALDAPRWSAWLAACLFALYPLTTVITVTLWKDVFFAIAVVLLVAVTIDMACNGARPLKRPWLFVLLACVGVGCMALRHNGPPVLLALCLIMFFLVPDERRRVAGFFVTCLVALAVFNGPILNAMGLHRTHVAFTVPSHHIAGHLAAGERPTDPDDLAFLNSIKPVDQWLYSCSLVNYTVFDPKFSTAVASRNVSRLTRIAAEMALRDPATEARHVACVSSLVWRLGKTVDEPMYLYTTGLSLGPDNKVHWLEANNVGLTEHSPFKGGEKLRRTMLRLVDKNWLSRPAAFLYLALFACLVAVARGRRWQAPLIVGVTLLAQSGVLVLANVAQDARYQLPVYIVSLCIVPVFLFARRTPGDGPVA